MTNLKVLDISDNINMYKTIEMLAAEAKKAAEGSGQEFDFIENKQHRTELLKRLPTVEHLICDVMLEVYICDTRDAQGYMPNLKTINRVPVEFKDLPTRTLRKQVLSI